MPQYSKKINRHSFFEWRSISFYKLQQHKNIRFIPLFCWYTANKKEIAFFKFFVLISNEKLNVVIDWEFTDLKFPWYDMAFLIGCLAMDHPDNLSSPAVRALQDTLYKNSFMPDEA